MSKSQLGQLVKRIIRQKGLKLRDVERKCSGEISNSYISRIISGDVNNLTVEKLVALARGLDTDPHELFTAAYGHPPLSRGEYQSSAPDAAMLVDMMQKVVADPQLMAMMQELIELWPEECQVVLTYLTELNERKKKSKQKKLPNNGATT